MQATDGGKAPNSQGQACSDTKLKELHSGTGEDARISDDVLNK